MRVSNTWEVTVYPECLAGKPEGKITLGRHRLRWEYNIKIGF